MCIRVFELQAGLDPSAIMKFALVAALVAILAIGEAVMPLI